jgi:RNA polymerase subunit RPABC4/transcription elongation factor Spt4
MRCVDCKVDLEENHKKCPLCGNKAVVSKQQIVLLTAPYPEQVADLKKKI